MNRNTQFQQHKICLFNDDSEHNWHAEKGLDSGQLLHSCHAQI